MEKQAIFVGNYGIFEEKNRLELETSIENALEKAIDRNELQLHYQPMINLITGDIVGVEALIRWDHPEYGSILPDDFIPIAEKSGLIIPMGEWALKTVCLQNKEWQEKGFSLIVSVNISPKQMIETDIVQTVEKILNETNLDPCFLELEITENIITDIEKMNSVLHELKKLGINICIDDFGTGYSSLYYLHQFPVDTIKIERTFIQDLTSKKKQNFIIKSMISLAHNLQLNIVAEGIETIEQLLYLQRQHCTIGQGFLFSEPLTVPELEAKVLNYKSTIKKFGFRQEEYDQWLAVHNNKNQCFPPSLFSGQVGQLSYEKQEMINELAATVAHEIRNPLTTLKGFVQLLEKDVGYNEYFKYIHTSIEEINEFTKKFLSLSKRGVN